MSNSTVLIFPMFLFLPRNPTQKSRHQTTYMQRTPTTNDATPPSSTSSSGPHHARVAGPWCIAVASCLIGGCDPSSVITASLFCWAVHDVCAVVRASLFFTTSTYLPLTYIPVTICLFCPLMSTQPRHIPGRQQNIQRAQHHNAAAHEHQQATPCVCDTPICAVLLWLVVFIGACGP